MLIEANGVEPFSFCRTANRGRDELQGVNKAARRLRWCCLSVGKGVRYAGENASINRDVRVLLPFSISTNARQYGDDIALHFRDGKDNVSRMMMRLWQIGPRID